MSNFEELCEKWMIAKQLENNAKAARVKLEDEILSNLTFNTGNSLTLRCGDYKLTATRKFAYSLNEEVAIPEGVDIYSTKVDSAKLKKYEKEDWVETKENKTTITVVKER